MEIDKEKALFALKYAGLLGHHYATLTANYRIFSESPTLKSAKEDALIGSTIWQRQPKNQWIMVWHEKGTE